MKQPLFLLCISLAACNLPTPKQEQKMSFAASLPTGNADYQFLQKGIDSCIAGGFTDYYIGAQNRTIDRPLIAAKWDPASNTYKTFTLRIHGNAQFWDVNGASKITATFKDAPILSLHLCKGCVVEGINFQGAYVTPAMTDAQFFQSKLATYGDTTCRDKSQSPYCAIAIDPFSPAVPADGGYPGLTHMYRGAGSGGSTGYTIKNCTFNNVTIGLMFSPSGYMTNCELMNVENIRIYNTKIGICGSQAQEKNNSYSRIACWGRTHTLFNWGGYGTGTPGLTYIDGVQVAGGVVRLVNRVSGGYFPLYMEHVFTEMLGQVGQWQSSGVGDKLENSMIGFAPISITGAFPEYGHIYGQANNKGVTIENTTLRYYGQYTTPILLNGSYTQIGNYSYVPIMSGYKTTDPQPGYTLPSIGYTDSLKLHTATTPGRYVVFSVPGSWIYLGMGIVGANGRDLINVSPNVKLGQAVNVSLYNITP